MLYDVIETAYIALLRRTLASSPGVLVAVGKDLQAVKLCSNKMSLN